MEHMPNNTSQTNNPLTMYDARRLAPASIEVMRDHADKPAIAAHTTKLGPVASGVLTALQDLDQLKAKQLSLLTTSDEQLAVLHGVMLEWTGILARDLEGFEIGAFTRDPDLVFDVVQKAKSLLRFVEEQGAELPYRDTLQTELSARIDGASGAAESAHRARVAVQDKQRELRGLMSSLHKGLIGLRRAVRAVLGASHIDYQRLRMSRRAAVAADESPPATAESSSASDTGERPSQVA